MQVEIASPFTSMRAILEVEDAKFDEGDYGPQIRADLSVVDDGQDGGNNGITFSDWFGLGKQQTEKPRIMPRSKAHQLLMATLGEVVEFEGREVARWEGVVDSIDPGDQFARTVRLYEGPDGYRVHESIWSLSAGGKSESSLYPVVGNLGYGTYAAEEVVEKWGDTSPIF